MCREPHGVWACLKFKSLDLNKDRMLQNNMDCALDVLERTTLAGTAKGHAPVKLMGAKRITSNFSTKKQALVGDKSCRSSSPREGNLVMVHQTHQN